MSIKVVINTCYGGFGLSSAAVEKMETATGEAFDCYSHPRHCPVLVSVVEEMGESANSQFSELSVVELKGTRYIVREYDGTEWIQEPEDVKWVEVTQ